MSSRRRNAFFSQSTQITGVVILLVAIVIVLLRFFAPSALVSLTSPLFRASSGIANTFHSSTSFFTSPATLTQELDSAKAEDATLADENRTLAGQVADLTKLLGTRAAAAPSVLAAVISRPPESPYDTLGLDQGSRADVIVGAVVSGPGGVPIGKIASVLPASSQAILFSSSDSTTDGWVGDHRTPVQLTGAGAGGFDASVPKDATIQNGDTVYATAGSAAAIGVVVRIDTDPSSAADTLRIEPLVDPFTLTWVLIARP